MAAAAASARGATPSTAPPWAATAFSFGAGRPTPFRQRRHSPHGCDIAAGSGGSALLTQLAALTGADIAASTDATGSASQRGKLGARTTNRPDRQLAGAQRGHAGTVRQSSGGTRQYGSWRANRC
ncbi:MAG: DUF4347 domain-containing protein [Propionivibrio sp.]|uniref:DUF4347 domain-containing protein n=1 Tax=Candidatus Propionivibrio dominans TaxID=2954373 RepID=A0A9D7FC83_9RHOO|nr:DUF4347 domain-containing protein [Candidatus Propionivibrio dominans]